MKDIVPELLEQIQKSFQKKINNSNIIKNTYEKIKHKTATYKELNTFAVEVGNILTKCFAEHISADTMPDGRMYYNIANRIITKTLGENYNIVVSAAEKVQNNLNKSAGLGLKFVKPKMNTSKMNGLINRLSSETDYSKIAWVLNEPVINFTQSIIDDSVRENALFHYKSGLLPKIARTPANKSCKWCQEVAGTYTYPDVPDGIYRRHENCRCIVVYDPGNGAKKRQDVWSKQWKDVDNSDKIKYRKTIGNKITDFYAGPNGHIIKAELSSWIGNNQYKKYLKNAEGEESKKFIRTAYRKTAIIGDGGTAAVRKFEKATGLNLGRNQHNHSKKVNDLIRQINNSLEKTISENDKKFLLQRLKELKEVQD